GWLFVIPKPAPSESALASGWSSFKEIPASGSALPWTVRLCAIFGVAKWTSPRTGFFSCTGSTSGVVEVARLTTFPPFNEFTPACELCAATAVEPAGAAPEGLLAELLCAYELTRSEEHTSELQSLRHLV